MLSETWPQARGIPSACAVMRSTPEDFQVVEHLGFELSGAGEHVFLYLQKRELNTQDLVRKISGLAGIHQRDIGYSGLKDRNALTRQWISVRMAGKDEPDWSQLEHSGNIVVLDVQRHQRKLKRGVHRSNQFSITLRQLSGDRAGLEQRLEQVKKAGVPNYFGAQRFGRAGATLEQATHWAQSGGGKISRAKRGMYYSALRACLFNRLLAQRVLAGSWEQVLDGDVCILNGSRSLFSCDIVDADIGARAAEADLHAGLPMWGRGQLLAGAARISEQAQQLEASVDIKEFLEREGLNLAYRSARVVPDNFCWHYSDSRRTDTASSQRSSDHSDSLHLAFELGVGSYATAVIAELVQSHSGEVRSGKGSE